MSLAQQPFIVQCPEAGVDQFEVSRVRTANGPAYKIQMGSSAICMRTAAAVEEWFIRKFRRSQMEEEEEELIQVEIWFGAWIETEFLYCNNDGVSEDDLLQIRKVLSDFLYFLGVAFIE